MIFYLFTFLLLTYLLTCYEHFYLQFTFYINEILAVLQIYNTVKITYFNHTRHIHIITCINTYLLNATKMY